MTSLAQQLHTAGDMLEAARRAVDELLERLLPSWRPRFPRELGWCFAPPDAIEVWDAGDASPPVVPALRRAGFAEVTLHDHPARKFLSCRCRPARSPE